MEKEKTKFSGWWPSRLWRVTTRALSSLHCKKTLCLPRFLKRKKKIGREQEKKNNKRELRAAVRWCVCVLCRKKEDKREEHGEEKKGGLATPVDGALFVCPPGGAAE